MIRFIDPYQQKLESELNRKIGYAVDNMHVGQPEGLLSNYCADALLHYSKMELNEPTDFAILNNGGLRKPILNGPISLRTIYELMPFDNLVVILELDGTKVQALLDQVAAKGGEAISGIKMTIKHKKAHNILINGVALNPEKTYRIATTDYLSEGNDQLTALKEHSKIFVTSVKLRDVFIAVIEESTKKGIIIRSSLDGRIYVD